MARGLFAGNAAHSFLRLDRPPSAMFGLMLGALGHAFGWPFPKGGSQALADALASYLAALGVRSTQMQWYVLLKTCREPARYSST